MADTVTSFETRSLPAAYDHLAPDGSEIRKLLRLKNGQLAHCTLPVKGVSSAVFHKTVEEIWYFMTGKGEVWRKSVNDEKVVEVGPGVCLTIPLGTTFQFRNTGDESLCFVISTMPPWPGPDEAVPEKNAGLNEESL